MNTSAPKPNYLFVNPNRPSAFTEGIRKILMDKLLALPGIAVK